MGSGFARWVERVLILFYFRFVEFPIFAFLNIELFVLLPKPETSVIVGQFGLALQVIG